MVKSNYLSDVDLVRVCRVLVGVLQISVSY